MSSSILLRKNEYIHIIDNNNGCVRTECGPKLINNLQAHEQPLSHTKQATILSNDEYAIIKNPFDEKTRKYLHGEKRVDRGPSVLILHQEEILESVSKVHVLRKDEALTVRALDDLPDGHCAGERFQITGPCRYIPTAHVMVENEVSALLIEEFQGIYVKNNQTGAKKLVRGPCSYMLSVDEELYEKPYSDLERSALSISPHTHHTRATIINLLKGEVVCVLDADKNERIESGPKKIMLEPDEHVKTLHLSAGKPKKPKQFVAAIIRLGPDFVSDQLELRMKDGALISLQVTYKWEFHVTNKSAHSIYSVPDFIGYICSNMVSRLRDVAAKSTFEEFNSGTVALLRKHLFTDKKILLENDSGDVDVRNLHGIFFDEISLLISEIDVKDSVPVNAQIRSLLTQSIQSNMIIVCKRLEQEAQVKAQKQRIQSQEKINHLKKKLIEAKNENQKIEQLEMARIDSKVKIMKAQAQKECAVIQEECRMKIQFEKMQQELELLNTEEGQRYLETLKLNALSNVPRNYIISSDEMNRMVTDV